MVVRADVLATPALLFESDRKKIQLAIDQTQPGAASLNLQGALDFARAGAEGAGPASRRNRVRRRRPHSRAMKPRGLNAAREFSLHPD